MVQPLWFWDKKNWNVNNDNRKSVQTILFNISSHFKIHISVFQIILKAMHKCIRYGLNKSGQMDRRKHTLSTHTHIHRTKIVTAMSPCTTSGLDNDVTLMLVCFNNLARTCLSKFGRPWSVFSIFLEELWFLELPQRSDSKAYPQPIFPAKPLFTYLTFQVIRTV